ncbi:MFS transporter [Pelagibacteraceae bacterium]|nr:MFS transporter [Pelagibacteraceae bacterium]MDC0412676.1 MFS transporter [Pelagibacteraceae bacterium]
MNSLNIKLLLSRKSLGMSLLGFSAGLPLLLIFSTLSVWLVKAGVERSTITLFSWAGFAYSFKFLWTPIVDHYRLPLLSKIGHRKSWLLLSQIFIIISIFITSYSDPSKNLLYTAIGIVLIAFSSATQDIVIDAFRIESEPIQKQGALSSMYLAGYRIAMIVSGAGSLWLASYFGVDVYNANTWKKVYQIMGCLMLIGVVTTLLSKEPTVHKIKNKNTSNSIKFLISLIIAIAIFFVAYNLIPKIFTNESIFLNSLDALLRIGVSFGGSLFILSLLSKIKFISIKEIKLSYIDPIQDFLSRYKKVAILILVLIGLYRIADIVMGVMANVFYLEKGYQISEIATYSKFFGLFATIIGGFLGGLYSMHKGVIESLLVGAIIAAFSNLLFAWLAVSDINITFLIVVITADNIASGFAGAAFVVYLSSLTSIKFTATQYALFSSMMLFVPKLIAGYAGGIVNLIGYSQFFIFTAILGLPVLVLIYRIKKQSQIKS